MARKTTQRALFLAALAAATIWAGGCAPPEKVSNPLYQGWAPYPVGAYAVFEGYQEDGSGKFPMRVTFKLVKKDEQKVIVEKTAEALKGPDGKPRLLGRAPWVQPALIDPAEHPRTHPAAKIKELGVEQVQIGGKPHLCAAREISVWAKLKGFVDEQQDMYIKAHLHPGIPGGLAKVFLRSRTLFRTVVITGQVVRYETHPGKEKPK